MRNQIKVQNRRVIGGDTADVATGCSEPVADSSDRSLMGYVVAYQRDRHRGQLLPRRSDDHDLSKQTSQREDYVNDERLIVEGEQRFGFPHARAFASSKHDGGRIGHISASSFQLPAPSSQLPAPSSQPAFKPSTAARSGKLAAGSFDYLSVASSE